MNIIPERFQHNRLFIILFMITVAIIIILSVSITWVTINMSEKFFIEKFSMMNTKLMDKFQANLESFDNSVVLASNNLLQSGTVRRILTEKESDVEKMNDYYNIAQKINYIKSLLNNNQMGIFFIGKNGVVYAADNTYWPIDDEKFKNSLLSRNTLKEPKKLIYQYDHHLTNNPFGKDNENYIVASRAFMDRTSGLVYGSMYFAIPETQFRTFYSGFTSFGNNVFLLDRKGIVVSSNAADLIGHQEKSLLHYAKDLEQSNQTYMVKSFKGKDQIILADYNPYLDMYLVNMVDKQEAIGHVINQRAIAYIVLAIVMVALMIVFVVSRRLTNSLSRLVRQIGNAPKYDFHQYVTEKGTYETRQIGRAFNSMLDELHEYVEKLMQAQKQQRNAELAALQQQINPHFLYNTLTTIKFMDRLDEKEEMEATITALISLLQNTISNGSEMITVKQELDNLKNYVFINQKRYGDRIRVNYYAASECMDHLVPKLMLQPFVENSFFHGFNHKTEGYIHVLVWQENSHLICEVIDNGDGMDEDLEGDLPDTKRKQQLFSGIGVRNVHERIQLIYGEPYGVNISSKPGEGTKIRIILPVSQK
ncbi:sensor histidine kinase [Bacillus sp. BRMEA1]|uniref:cache domain-containing sensor histidine kinase n=1 Tax=Neobacillus endophyticus TaxID=2738405 RepID=UPI0015676844|nr:sensor histidine kinase [Neobacillus endophyticus]NRD76967.1 sensor histidine kinase [Neobacillus endophyticus]